MGVEGGGDAREGGTPEPSGGVSVKRFVDNAVRIMALLLAWTFFAVPSYAVGNLSFSPTPVPVTSNDTVDVEIWVDADVDSIHCFRVLVDSVDAGITLLNVTRGSLIPSGNAFFFWKDTLGGYDIFACFLGPGTFTNGPGSLAKMTFVTNGSPCGYPLTYNYVLVQDVQLDSLPVSHSDGEFSSPACCACPCAADPACDGVASVLDVVETVAAAFRNAAPVFDPSCPALRTDVNCSGSTSVVDVVLMVNVAFRNANPATEFCQPCQ